MAYSDVVLADSPLAYWKLDETSGATQFADSSGNSRPATISGTPVYDSANYADVRSVRFTGSQYGSVAAPAWFGSLSAFSAEAWFKATSSANNGVIVGRDDAAGSPGGPNRIFRLAVINTGQVRFFLTNSSGTYVEFTTPGTYLDGLWHHAVVTYDGANCRIYVDGSLRQTVALTGVTATGGTAPILIGTSMINTPGNYQQFTGTIDEVALYNVALDATQVSDHYAAATPVVAPPDARLTGITVEALSTGVPDARLTGVTVEALSSSGVVDARLTGMTVEVLTPAVAVTQVETVYLETLASGTPAVQVGTLYLETLTETARMQTEAVYTEVAASGVPLLQAESVYTEVAAAGIPLMQTETVYLEVIVSTIRGFRGWGMPVGG